MNNTHLETIKYRYNPEEDLAPGNSYPFMAIIRRMTMYQLQVDDRPPFEYLIGYFDPTMKDKPAELAFRVVDSVSKSEVTLFGACAIAQEIARENPHLYKYES